MPAETRRSKCKRERLPRPHTAAVLQQAFYLNVERARSQLAARAWPARAALRPCAITRTRPGRGRRRCVPARAAGRGDAPTGPGALGRTGSHWDFRTAPRSLGGGVVQLQYRGGGAARPPWWVQAAGPRGDGCPAAPWGSGARASRARLSDRRRHCLPQRAVGESSLYTL